jgi:hydrogenase nickel incorporation protein HypA/HybF
VHEFGIASEIWEAAKRAAETHGGNGGVRVCSITVELGELNLIEDEQLRFWVTALAERDGSPQVDLRITHVPPTVRCRQCGEVRSVERRESEVESRLSAGWPLRPEGPCPRCGSSELEVVGGREIRVVSAEIEPEANDESRG